MPAGERFPEAFGMSFLMPSTGIRRHFFETVSLRSDFQVSDLVRLSCIYGVSVQAMTLRLESLGLVAVGTLSYLQEERFRVRDAQRTLGLQETQRSDRPYSDRYLLLAVCAFNCAKISEGKLANLLRVDRITARGLVEERLRHMFQESEGETACEYGLDQSLFRFSESA